MLNALYILPFSDLWKESIRSLLESGEVAPLVVVADSESLTHKIFFDSVKIHADAANQGLVPEDLVSFFGQRPPIDMKIVSALRHYEDSIYEMMNRRVWSDRHLGLSFEISYDEKKLRYRKSLGFWNGVFDQFRPNVVIAASAPHRVFDYIIALICNYKGIPFLYPESTGIPRYHLFASYSFSGPKVFFQGFEEGQDQATESSDARGSPDLVNWLEKKRGEYKDSLTPALSLNAFFSPDAIKIRELVEDDVRRQFFAVTEWWVRARWYASLSIKLLIDLVTRKKMQRSICWTQESKLPRDWYTRSFRWRYRFRQLVVSRRIASSQRWYRNNTVSADLEHPFIYFAAPYQRERSTVPDCNIYQQLHLSLNLLDKALPSGWKIYFREHPSVHGRWPPLYDNNRSIEFYRTIKKLCPNVHFIATEGSPFPIIDASQCVAVVGSGTTTLKESIIRGKMVLYFGDDAFKGLPGIVEVAKKKDVEQALSLIRGGAVNFPYEDVKNAFCRLVDKCVDLSFYFEDNMRLRSGNSKPSSNAWTKEDVATMHQAIMSAIHRTRVG